MTTPLYSCWHSVHLVEEFSCISETSQSLGVEGQISMFSESFILAFWKSSVGKGSPGVKLRSFPFTSRSDNRFPSFLSVFELFRLILWNTDLKMPVVPSLLLCLTVATTGEVRESCYRRKNWTLKVFSGAKVSSSHQPARKTQSKACISDWLCKLCGCMARCWEGLSVCKRVFHND